MAAVFSSQNPEDTERAVRDSVRALIHEARQWLTQVHLQALVPVTYTSDKSPRLLVKEHSLFGLTSVHSIEDQESQNLHGRILLQRGPELTVLNSLTREEIPLAKFRTKVLGVKVVNSGLVLVMTKGISSNFSVELLDLSTGKHLKSAPLTEDKLLWYDMRSPNAVFFATDKGIKSLDVECMSVANVLSAPKPWEASVVSHSKPEKVVIVLTNGDKQEIRQMRLKDISSLKSTRVKKEPVNQHCPALVTTKDGRFIVHVTERLAHVIDAREFVVSSSISHHDLPVVKVALSRSHEHVFLAYANGAVTGHTLLSGNEVLNVRTRPSPRPQNLRPDGGQVGRSAHGPSGSKPELVTAMVTSEDDHFLLMGTNLGQVYIFHLPTGQQILDISTGQASLTNLVFLTDHSHFQHLLTVDSVGKALHWNLRPLFA